MRHLAIFAALFRALFGAAFFHWVATSIVPCAGSRIAVRVGGC